MIRFYLSTCVLFNELDSFTILQVYQFASLPVCQFASLPVYLFTSLPVCNGTARFFTLALIVEVTERLSNFMRLLKSIYKKNSCYDEQKCICEYSRNFKSIRNLFNCTINLKTIYSVHLFSTALYELMFALFY